MDLLRYQRNQAELARRNHGSPNKQQRLSSNRAGQSGLTVEVARRFGSCPLAKKPETHRKVRPRFPTDPAKDLEKGVTTLARKTTSLVSTEGSDLPLQDVVVDTLDIDTLTRIMTCKVRRRFKYLLSLFVSTNAETTYRAKFMLSDADTKQLSDNGIIERINHADIQGFAWPFCVAELKKKGWRRRMILWPQEGNEKVRQLFHYKPSLNLYNRIKYVSSVWHDGPALRVDLKASFYQIPLSSEMSQHLAFWAGSRDNGGWYAFKRLPMGHTLSPEIMQLAMSSLMCDERFTMIPRLLRVCSIDTWLDDARVLAPSLKKLEATSALIKFRMRTCEATIGEWEIAHDYEFIGIHWDHRHHMVSNA
ncbi:unnamed protein product, partial [Trypanosoma congolense IL3000]